MPTRPASLPMPVIIGSAVVVGLGLGTPLALQLWAQRAIDDAPCARGEQVAPDAALTQALKLLDVVAGVPGFGRAGERATEVASSCQAAFHDACDGPRDAAVDAARMAVAAHLGGVENDADPAVRDADWHAHLDTGAVQALCEDWGQWRQWLDESGLDADAACAVCAVGGP